MEWGGGRRQLERKRARKGKIMKEWEGEWEGDDLLVR